MPQRRLIAFIACLALGAGDCTLAVAAEDSDAFREIHVAEWEFRSNEYPLLGGHNQTDGEMGRLARVSEADQLRRYEYWKGVRASLDELSCERLDPCFDIDTVADLQHLAEGRTHGLGPRCAHTLRYLDDHDLWRHLRGAARSPGSH